MSDERVPAHIWPLIAGVCAGVLGVGCLFGGWLGLAPYPLAAGGVLLLIAALVGYLSR
jgi:hypothetical protein